MRRMLAVLLLFTGCGRAGDFSGPAPEGGMRCALEHGLAAGYELIEGSPEEGFLRLTQRLPPSPGEARAVQPEPNLGDVVLREAARRPVENQILVSEERGRLNLTLLGISDEGVRVDAGSNAEDLARSILALCTTTPPVFPAATGQQVPPNP
jgi:hypothetical protein